MGNKEKSNPRPIIEGTRTSDSKPTSKPTTTNRRVSRDSSRG